MRSNDIKIGTKVLRWSTAIRNCGWRGAILKCVTLMLLVVFACGNVFAAESTRKERRLITEGNTLYRSGKYADAKVKYRAALEENAGSPVARFNLGLCDVRLAYLNKDNDSISSRLMTEARTALLDVAKLGKENAPLASKANYNLGNLAFEEENYQEAISLYKQSLRLNPAFDDARRNLRIAQLKMQNQQDNQDNKDNKDQNKDQDKEQDNQQDQNKDNQQDQQKDQQQDQDKNQDRNQDKDSEKDRNQPQPQPNQLSEQAAEQILNAVENNEQKARQGNNNAQKAKGHSARQKRW